MLLRTRLKLVKAEEQAMYVEKELRFKRVFVPIQVLRYKNARGRV